MRAAPLVLVLLAMAGCNRGGGNTTDAIVGHRWARTLAECGDTYLDFSRNMIDFVRDGRPVNSLSVLRITSDGDEVTFVIAGAGAASDAAMVFRVEGDSLALVRQGALDGRQQLALGMKGNRSFVMRRCPSAY
ncbi:hypothetical protein [Sphingomonas sp. KR3-1]|uniref:hypothetical protein n=1 Tax=Sphingomonas sp. KR3-1 TaxID=3156611 RepID=UPI0032B5E05D